MLKIYMESPSLLPCNFTVRLFRLYLYMGIGMSNWNRNLNISLNKGIYSVTCPLLRIHDTYPSIFSERNLISSDIRNEKGCSFAPCYMYIHCLFTHPSPCIYSYFHAFGQGRHHWLPAAAPPRTNHF